MPIRHLSPSGQFVSRAIWTTFKSLIASDFGLVAAGFIVGGDAKKARSKPSMKGVENISELPNTVFILYKRLSYLFADVSAKQSTSGAD
jgi:hypothetical protein